MDMNFAADKVVIGGRTLADILATGTLTGSYPWIAVMKISDNLLHWGKVDNHTSR